MMPLRAIYQRRPSVADPDKGRTTPGHATPRYAETREAPPGVKMTLGSDRRGSARSKAPKNSGSATPRFAGLHGRVSYRKTADRAQEEQPGHRWEFPTKTGVGDFGCRRDDQATSVEDIVLLDLIDGCTKRIWHRDGIKRSMGPVQARQERKCKEHSSSISPLRGQGITITHLNLGDVACK